MDTMLINNYTKACIKPKICHKKQQDGLKQVINYSANDLSENIKTFINIFSQV